MSTHERTNPTDLRVFRRAALCAEVEVIDAQGARFVAPADNLSEGGIFVLTRVALPMMSRATLRFILPGDDAGGGALSVDLDAHVRWLRPSGRFAAGIGFEFIDAPDEVVLAIQAYIERHEPMAWEDGPEVGMALPRAVALEYVPWIRRVARAQAPALSMHVDDLIGAGFLGLLEAYKSFRSSAGVPFESYARLRIRGAMRDEARRADLLSRTQRSVARQLRTAQRALEQQGSDAPTAEDLAAQSGMEVAQVLESQRDVNAVSPARSTDTPAEAGVAEGASPEEALLERERRGAIDAALEALPPRLRDVLRMHYGDAMNLRAIATVLGVSEARVSQLHSDAVRRLRDACAT